MTFCCGNLESDKEDDLRMFALYAIIRLFLLGVATALWVVFPSLFLGWSSITDGHEPVIFLYVAVLWAFCSVFDCFAIGQARIRELVVWYGLALFFADLSIWVVEHLMFGLMQTTDFLFLLSLWFTQSAAALLMMPMLTRVFFQTYPVRHVCAIVSGTEYEKRVLAKMDRYPERFSVDSVVYQDDVDWDNLCSLAPDCNNVIVGEISLSHRQALIEDGFRSGRMLTFMPSPADVIHNGVYPTQLSDALLFVCSNKGLALNQRIAKRIVDILGALIGIIFSAIPVAICAVIIKATDGGTVFYKQKRLTRNGEEFELIKLRSMSMDAEKDGIQFSSTKDARVTTIGRFIRACRLDETPQFLNVLTGSLSLVGPRAERPEIAGVYTESHPAFAYRLKVKAGLTGYAQINGRYNTELGDKLLMDLYYIEHWSFIGDIALLFETLKVLFSSDSTSGYDEGRIDRLFERDNIR